MYLPPFKQTATKRDDVLNSRVGNILYGAGLVAAVLCVFYAIDAIWVYQSGKSLLPISGRFISREEIFATVAISVVVAVLSWRAGSAARAYLSQ